VLHVDITVLHRIHSATVNSTVSTEYRTLQVNITVLHNCRWPFLSGGMLMGSPLSCLDLFLYTITLPAVGRDAPPSLSYTILELASRVLLSSKKPAKSDTGITVLCSVRYGTGQVKITVAHRIQSATDKRYCIS
jgi:hypothetical protein